MNHQAPNALNNNFDYIRFQHLVNEHYPPDKPFLTELFVLSLCSKNDENKSCYPFRLISSCVAIRLDGIPVFLIVHGILS